jgi:hypothetical protein
MDREFTREVRAGNTDLGALMWFVVKITQKEHGKNMERDQEHVLLSSQKMMKHVGKTEGVTGQEEERTRTA